MGYNSICERKNIKMFNLIRHSQRLFPKSPHILFSTSNPNTFENIISNSQKSTYLSPQQISSTNTLDDLFQDTSTQKKIIINLSESSPLLSMVKKPKTARQKILEIKYYREWIFCFAISVFLVTVGHMYFPETFLSTNLFFTTSYDVTRDAQKQVLSGKYGRPIISHKSS